MNNYEKLIYNTYLKVSRSENKLPYKFRKNFDSIKDKDFICIKKLNLFFKKFPHVNMDEYFAAPYRMYPDEKYFGLDYFTTMKATKAYTLHQKKKAFQDPDNIEQLENIKNSLKFILQYCKQNNIEIKNYISHQIGNTNAFILHLKEHKINVFCLFGFPDFELKIKQTNREILRFTLGDELINNLSTFKTKLFASKKALRLINAGIEKICLLQKSA